jgi:tRNA(Ile)-lysidine synthase
LNKIATGHTLDDQAETVLMRMIRGAGLRGIGGIYPRLAVENEDGEFCGEIVRPLLSIRRRELEQYLRDIGQAWREDSTNDDPKFTRNRVRKLLVPLLEKEFNPAVAENLAELAEIARGEEDYWENEIAGWMGTGVHWSEPAWARQPATGLVQIGPARDGHTNLSDASAEQLRSKIDNTRWLVMNASVDRLWFLGEPIAVQRRVVKAMGERAGIPLEFKHVEEILRFAAEEGASGKELSLPLGWKMVREPDELMFVTPDLRQPAPSQDYEYDLPVPGEVAVSETGSCIEVRRVSPGGEAYNPEHLLDADSLPGRLKVRNWRAGDRFWPAHTKSPKKVKELLQERHVAQPERRLWPVVLSGDEIVWMRGFPLPARYQAKPGHEGVLIRERTVAAASE